MKWCVSRVHRPRLQSGSCLKLCDAHKASWCVALPPRAALWSSPPRDALQSSPQLFCYTYWLSLPHDALWHSLLPQDAHHSSMLAPHGLLPATTQQPPVPPWCHPTLFAMVPCLPCCDQSLLGGVGETERWSTYPMMTGRAERLFWSLCLWARPFIT